jgi:GAF domain-containing protein
MSAATDFIAALIERLGPAPSPQEVVDVLVPEAADLVQMFVRVNDELRLTAYRHINPEHHPILQELATVHRPSIDHPTDPVALVMRTREARLSTWIQRAHVERVTPDTRVHAMFDVLRPRAIIIVPLSAGPVCYGALVIVLSSSGRRFMEGDLEFMKEFAARVGPIVRLDTAS